MSNQRAEFAYANIENINENVYVGEEESIRHRNKGFQNYFVGP